MILFSNSFSLDKTQSELDFVDIPVNTDIPLFIDPFALSLRSDRWSQRAHSTVINFFEQVVLAIREGDNDTANQLMQYLQEPNETRFGLSRGRPRGAGIGPSQAEELLTALRASSAVKTGFLTSLQDCELLVEGVGRDKISDLTTNIIREHLAEYTKEQCDLWNVPTKEVSLGPSYSSVAGSWISTTYNLPVVKGRPILLVPKAIARYDPAYNHQKYYRQIVLTYLQAEHLNANSSLVRTLKNRKRKVYKKDIEATFPCTKENLFKFSKDHPDALYKYRDKLAALESGGRASVVEPDDEQLIAEALSAALNSIPAGSENASKYHQLMIGVLEFLFFPELLCPRKEREIHQGRKRIDIAMENGARSGIFLRLHLNRGMPCAFVVFECKNYVSEISNPELDQIAGRFSPNRGKVGFICCRKFEDRKLFTERCRDTFKDERGLVVPLDDKTVHSWLQLIANGNRKQLDQEISSLIDQVWYS